MNRGNFKSLFNSLIVMALLLAMGSAKGAWTTKSEVDAMTDQVRRSALVTNLDGHSLSLYRGPNNAAWVAFVLNPRSGDQVAPQKAPAFRVDKFPPHELEAARDLSKSLGLDLYVWEPKWINFVIWHGNDGEGRSEGLVQLMSGRSVVFRYYLAAGGYKDTTFDLAGAGAAIAAALGIPEIADAGLEGKAKARREAVVASTAKCEPHLNTDAPKFKACMEKVLACSKTSSGSAEAFQHCLK